MRGKKFVRVVKALPHIKKQKLILIRVAKSLLKETHLMGFKVQGCFYRLGNWYLPYARLRGDLVPGALDLCGEESM